MAMGVGWDGVCVCVAGRESERAWEQASSSYKATILLGLHPYDFI